MSDLGSDSSSSSPFEPDDSSPHRADEAEMKDLELEDSDDIRHLGSSESSEDSDENEAPGLPENDMGVTARDGQSDANLLEQIIDTSPEFDYLQFKVCRPNGAVDVAASELTDGDLKLLKTSECTALAKKCKYQSFASGGGRVLTKNVSSSGSKTAVVGRLLAYFHRYRQDRARGNISLSRPLQTTATFTPEEDARLLEIMMDKSYRHAIRFIFKKAPRAVLDNSDGSPMLMAWINVVAVLYNNFDKYRPTYRFPTDDVLKVMDPNKSTIGRRVAEHLRNRFAQIRSRFTVIYAAWKSSGQNDPERITQYCSFLQNQVDRSCYYLFRVLWASGDDSFMYRTLRLIPETAQMDTSNPSLAIAGTTAAAATATAAAATATATAATATTHKAGSAELHGDLQHLLHAMQGGGEQDKNENLLILQSNRDRASDAMDRLADEVESAPNVRVRKRKRAQYKRSKKEYIQLSEQVAEITKIPFNRDDELSLDSSLSSQEEKHEAE